MKMKPETEVAIEILVACALSNERRLRTEDAAAADATTADLAAHIVLKLVNAGFVKAKRGRNGGLELLRPAQTVSLGDIICRLEAQSPGASKGAKATGEQAEDRGLDQVMPGANNTVKACLDRFSISDLAHMELPMELDEPCKELGLRRARRGIENEQYIASKFQKNITDFVGVEQWVEGSTWPRAKIAKARPSRSFDAATGSI